MKTENLKSKQNQFIPAGMQINGNHLISSLFKLRKALDTVITDVWEDRFHIQDESKRMLENLLYQVVDVYDAIRKEVSVQKRKIKKGITQTYNGVISKAANRLGMTEEYLVGFLLRHGVIRLQ